MWVSAQQLNGRLPLWTFFAPVRYQPAGPRFLTADPRSPPRFPCPPQLSPRHQAILAVLLLLPMAFFTPCCFTHTLHRELSGSGRGVAGEGRGGTCWMFAAASSVGTSLLTVALSCVTDLHCRRSFLRQERVRQQQQEGREQEEHSRPKQLT